LDAVVEGPRLWRRSTTRPPIPGIDDTVHVARIIASRRSAGLAIVIDDADKELLR
jgi:hypothetical protein